MKQKNRPHLGYVVCLSKKRAPWKPINNKNTRWRMVRRAYFTMNKKPPEDYVFTNVPYNTSFFDTEKHYIHSYAGAFYISEPYPIPLSLLDFLKK